MAEHRAEGLLKLLPRLDGFVLNDSEAQQLTREDNVFAALKKSTSWVQSM